MKNRILSFFLAVILLLTAGCCASAEAIPTQQIEAMLLTTTSEDRGEFPVLGYDILGQKKDGRDWYFYLAAAVCRYGYMGGYCVEFSGWSGPCTLVLQQVNEEWIPKEILTVEDYSQIPDIMPKNMEKKFLQGNFSSDRINKMLQEYISRYKDPDIPLGDYSDASGKLSDIYGEARNILIAFEEPWPLGCTTVETVEDDERMIYSKA